MVTEWEGRKSNGETALNHTHQGQIRITGLSKKKAKRKHPISDAGSKLKLIEAAKGKKIHSSIFFSVFGISDDPRHFGIYVQVQLKAREAPPLSSFLYLADGVVWFFFTRFPLSHTCFDSFPQMEGGRVKNGSCLGEIRVENKIRDRGPVTKRPFIKMCEALKWFECPGQ